MAIDFSWLITALNNIVANINSFFSGIWGSITQIANTGQGIFAGLANFGGWIYQGFVDAFTRIYNGLTWFGDQLRGGLEWVGTQLANAYNFIASNLFSFGQWLWAGIQGFANMVVNGVIYMANSIWGFLVNSWTTIYTAITSYKTAIDSWWGGLMIAFRNKMKASLMFSVTTYIAWNSAMKIPEAKSLKDIAYGLGGILLSPFPAYLISEMIDVMIPTPTTTTFKVTPDFGAIDITPPTLNPYAPVPPTPEAPIALGVGVGVVVTPSAISMGSFEGIAATVVTGEAVSESEEESSIQNDVTVEVETEAI